MKITIKKKDIILFFLLTFLGMLFFIASEKITCREVVLDHNVSGVIKCQNSKGESMDYPNNACHLYGKPVNISVGDVISFRKEDHNVIHRVVDIEEIKGVVYYIPKGDNNWISDEPITLERIEYKVIETLYFES